jgi:hypothetical protein
MAVICREERTRTVSSCRVDFFFLRDLPFGWSRVVAGSSVGVRELSYKPLT